MESKPSLVSFELLRTLSAIVVAIATAWGVYLAHGAIVPDAPKLEAAYLDEQADKGQRNVLLKWSRPLLSKNVRAFNILLRFNDEAPGVFARIKTVDAETQEHRTSCPKSRTCVYRVVAVNRMGLESPWSNFQRCPAYDNDTDRCIYDPQGRNN